MQGLQKSKRVSWASDANLCRVKLFLSEESPSLIGLDAQDYLQAKASSSTGVGSDDNLPPGFEGTHPATVLHNRLSQIPVIQWQCPARFVIDPTWQVVAGDESNEVKYQNERELRVLEAVYPRPSAIPPNPSLLMGINDSHDADQLTPVIPITPVEDEDAAADASDQLPTNTESVGSQVQISTLEIPSIQSGPTSSQSPAANFIQPAVMALGVEPEIVKAAYNALSAVTENNDHANLIDPDLLVKILSDPKLIEKLGLAHGAIPGPQITQSPRLLGTTLPDPPLVPINRTEAVSSSLAATPSRTFYPPTGRVGPIPGPVSSISPPPLEIVSARPAPAAPVKDINYYKSLIQQHGGERPETLSQFDSHHHQFGGPSQELASNPRSRDLKPKIMKPCMYFNSSRGCRHGANCAFQHDVSSQQRVNNNSMQEVQSAKRMKMDREFTGS